MKKLFIIVVFMSVIGYIGLKEVNNTVSSVRNRIGMINNIK